MGLKEDNVNDPDVKITAFLSVFETKLEKLIKRIRNDLEKKKKGQKIDTKQLKNTIAEAKNLKKHVKKMRSKEGIYSVTVEIACPHCQKKSSHVVENTRLHDSASS